MAYDDEYRNTLLDGILEEFKTLNSTLRELVNSVEPKEEQEEHQQNDEYPTTMVFNKGDYVVLNGRYKAVFLSEDINGYVLLTDDTGITNYRAPKTNIKKVPFYEWINYVYGGISQ